MSVDSGLAMQYLEAGGKYWPASAKLVIDLWAFQADCKGWKDKRRDVAMAAAALLVYRVSHPALVIRQVTILGVE